MAAVTDAGIVTILNQGEADIKAKDESRTTRGEGVIHLIVRKGKYLAVKAVKPGVSRLKGITKDGSGKTVTCTVAVRDEVTGMTLIPVADINNVSGLSADKSEKAMYNTFRKYTDTGVSFRSSDTRVLTVNNKGKISVKKGAAGKTAAVFIVSQDNKYAAQILITVR